MTDYTLDLSSTFHQALHHGEQTAQCPLQAAGAPALPGPSFQCVGFCSLLPPGKAIGPGFRLQLRQ